MEAIQEKERVMQLAHIALDHLSISPANMRASKKAPAIGDILPSVRARGVLVPLLVRANGSPDTYEIVAGRRRFFAAKAVADESGTTEPLPCAVMEAGDDAAALEASLIENTARLDPSEVVQWETFTKLIREGRTPQDIAMTFGLPDLTVRRVLALGNLLPRIRALYASEQIDRVTIRHLTLASKSQQKAWLALAEDDDAYCPTGHQLKAWLFGGQSIAVKHALFEVEASGLTTIADLFGEDAYFADPDAFWAAQNAALSAKRVAYIEDGWADAIIVPSTEHFAAWEYEKAGKRKGGRVYLAVRSSGEVTIHEGCVSRREAARAARGETGDPDRKPARPEVTSTMQTYLDLHRHAAVRASLTGHPGVALRLMIAHVIAGSPLIRVSPEPQATRNEEVRDSLDNSKAEAAFDGRRRAVLALLGYDEDTPTVVGGRMAGIGYDGSLVTVFHRLLDLPDPAVMEVLTIVMGETLDSGSVAVEAVGLHLGVDMASYWQADVAFFSLLRDREVLTRIVAEVAGEAVAAANATEKTKAMKTIVRDNLGGENGREKVAGWVPRWMAFPPSAYTTRGGFGTVAAHARVAAAAAEEEVQLDENDAESGPEMLVEGREGPADAPRAEAA